MAISKWGPASNFAVTVCLLGLATRAENKRRDEVTSLYERAHDAYRAARRDVAPRALKEKGLELEAGGMACIAACRDCTASATAILLLQRCRVRGETLHTVRCSGRVWP